MSTAMARSQDSPTDLWDNPMGTFGFEFVEYTAEDSAALGRLFEQLGFRAVARHRAKAVTHYRQGDINFIVKTEPRSFARIFARAHGPSACAIAFRVRHAGLAHARAPELGAEAHRVPIGPMELNIPAIRGIGGILLQIFTGTVIGPIFFESIQRKGDEGFGEGNFQALFGSIEQDQIERGVLTE